MFPRISMLSHFIRSVLVLWGCHSFVFLPSEAQISWIEERACRVPDGQLTLRCPTTTHRIMILSANYGNSSGHNCSGDFPLNRHLRTKAQTPNATFLEASRSLNADLSSSVGARCSHDVTSFVKDICSGRDVCLIEIEGNIFRSPCNGNESLNVKFACIPASQVISACNRNLTASHGHILSPGYPEFYPGPSKCSWRISADVGKNILIMLNDLSLRPQSAKDNACQDYLLIYEDDRQLVRTCHSYPFNLQVASHSAKISLVSTSKGWTSKGVWLFYQVIGCSNPYRPDLVSLTARNYTTATIKCHHGFFFFDEQHPFEEMTLRCVDGVKWDRSVPNCSNDTAWRNTALDNIAKARRTPMASLSGATLEQIVISGTVAGVLLLIFIAALGIALSVRRHRRRGLVYHNHEIEHLNTGRKAPRAHLDSASDLAGNYPLTEMRD